MLASSVAVKRVVTCFILSSSTEVQQQPQDHQQPVPKSFEWSSSRQNLRVAVFQRRSSMPTFPSHWAGISGSIEKGEEPWETAQRELQEETNLLPTITKTTAPTIAGEATDQKDGVACELVKAGGLYMDAPFKKDRVIRVYPFVVRLQSNESTCMQTLELRGTEHDTFRFVSIPELEQLEPVVPGLATAFHHATYGQYLECKAIPEPIWEWSEDRVNGAATLAKRALTLAMQHPTASLATMAALRPTMVPIVNVLRALEQQLQNTRMKKEGKSADDSRARHVAGKAILDSLDQEVERSALLGAKTLMRILQQQQAFDEEGAPSTFTIATFSRSSTILRVIQRFITEQRRDRKLDQQQTIIHILCAKSTPGDEGLLMKQDLAKGVADQEHVFVECVEDDALHQFVLQGDVDLVVVGSDCIMDHQVVNKIGTKSLAETCHRSRRCQATPPSPVPTMVCIADRWKLWEDSFSPPLEDIFECVPRSLLDHVVVPPPEIISKTASQ